MWTATICKQALEIAIKTAAQVALATLGVDGLGILDVDWAGLGSVVALAVIGSFLTSVLSSEAGGSKGSPSAVSLE